MTLDTTALRRLHGAATAGKWRTLKGCANSHCFEDVITTAAAGQIAFVDGDNNAAIVALHNAAPALLDAADELSRVKAVLADVETAAALSRAIAKALAGGTASKPKSIDVKAAQAAIAEIDRLIWPF